MRNLGSTLAVLIGLLGRERGGESIPPMPSADDPAVAADSVAADPVAPSTAVPDGCSDPASCASEGDKLAFVHHQPAEARPMLEYACAEGSAVACVSLSTILRGDMKDPDAAHLAATRGCELGSHAACIDLGIDESMGFGGASLNPTSGYARFTAACEAKVGLGCRYAGIMVHELVLGREDDALAMMEFDTGCTLGDPLSCYNAGALIMASGSDQLAEAKAYLDKACEAGDPDGCAGAQLIVEQLAMTAGKVADANLHIGSATVDGLTVNELECRVTSGGTGLLGNMVLIGALAKRKSAIDKCGKSGTEVEVTWTARGGKIVEAAGEGTEGACVAKVLAKLATPVDGECATIIVLGK